MAKQRFHMGGMMGGASANNMLKQAQKMQQEMLKAQEEIEQTEFEATSGGGAVSVKMNGKKELSEVIIQPEACDPDDIEMLSDIAIHFYGIHRHSVILVFYLVFNHTISLAVLVIPECSW